MTDDEKREQVRAQNQRGVQPPPAASSRLSRVPGAVMGVLETGAQTLVAEGVSLVRAVKSFHGVSASNTFTTFAAVLGPVVYLMKAVKEASDLYKLLKSGDKAQLGAKAAAHVVNILGSVAVVVFAALVGLIGSPLILNIAFIAAPVLVLTMSFATFAKEYYIARQQRKEIAKAQNRLDALSHLPDNDPEKIAVQAKLTKLKAANRYQTRRALTSFLSLLSLVGVAIVVFTGLPFLGPLAIAAYALSAFAASIDIADKIFFKPAEAENKSVEVAPAAQGKLGSELGNVVSEDFAKTAGLAVTPEPQRKASASAADLAGLVRKSDENAQLEVGSGPAPDAPETPREESTGATTRQHSWTGDSKQTHTQQQDATPKGPTPTPGNK